MSSRHLLTVTRPLVAFNAVRTIQRSIYTSSICCNNISTPETTQNNNVGQKKEFAEAIAGKFINQVKKQYHNTSTAEPTRYVQIDNLPSTVTKEDIMKMAREAFPNGDKNIIEVVFLRNDEFNFKNKCVVLMSDIEEGRLLYDYANRRSVGGNIVKARFLGKPNSSPPAIMNPLRRPELVSVTDYESASGRSVVMVGFPKYAKPEHVEGYLRSKNFFPVEGVSENVVKLETKKQSTVSKFLVKFDSESEAWRCVRTFHNTNYHSYTENAALKLQLSVAY
ncbi:hypothetical protein BDB01DRAFT_894112 [Pilobolus umbonatus]|nr:hypothetical protein BDB01DRAFT_894112 [Pilobolus umbonatus]